MASPGAKTGRPVRSAGFSTSRSMSDMTLLLETRAPGAHPCAGTSQQTGVKREYRGGGREGQGGGEGDGNRESGIGNRESGIGNRESGNGRRQTADGQIRGAHPQSPDRRSPDRSPDHPITNH